MSAANASANAVTAKARSMYGKMLTANQYAELSRKQTLQEIASFLKEHTHFGPDLEDVRGSIIYRRQLETLLRRHVFHQYMRLAPYAGSRTGVYGYIVLETEIDLILSCLSQVLFGKGETFVAELSTFFQPYVGFDILALANVRTVEQLISVLDRTPYAPLLQRCIQRGEDPLYSACEHALRAWYFDALLGRARESSAGRAQKDLETLICGRAEVMNLCTIYRLKKFYRMPPDKIRRRLYPHRWRLSPRETERLLTADGEEAFLRLLRETAYGRYVDPDDSFLEEQLDRARRRQERRLLRFSTDPQVIYTAFMLLSDKETENVIRVIEGVHYGMKPEKIESLLYLV